MAISIVVAVTDGDWFESLRNRPDLAEVNFWAPSATAFKALQPGELFLFKLHAPKNYIVGGGIFAYANSLPCSLAWEAFGVSNGANSLSVMRTRIQRYRRANPNDRSDFLVGCRILTQPFFFEERNWIPVPDDWSPNIVTFKTYSTADTAGLQLWESVNAALAGANIAASSNPIPRYGEPVLVTPRLGQGAFRVLVTDIYHRCCAVTSERTLPALDTAHIRPYAEGGEHAATNGLLLRRDVHSLFDAGYVTITPKLTFEVSRRIREEFENGRHYYALHGHEIARPSRTDFWPDPEALKWHNENRFRA
jgi:putative restriction endonuclease